jgi:Holliday junction resolvase-like predicted endonuclease
MEILKSSRHSKIAGDFGEALVLYWLSRDGFECIRVDHTGIDLIARNRHTQERMGISVKTRSRFAGTENVSINLPHDGFEKVRKACEAFACQPYYAIVVDAGGLIRCFLLTLARLEELAPGRGRMSYWRMSAAQLALYRSDLSIKFLEMRETACTWWPTPAP